MQDEEKSFNFAKQAKSIAEDQGDNCQVIKYKGVMAGFDRFYPLDSSIQILEKCLVDLKKESCDVKLRKKVLRDLAWINRLAGNYKKALEYCNISLDEFADDQRNKIRILNSMGAIFSFMGKTEEATKSFLDAYDIMDEEGINNKAMLLNNVCTVYNDNGFIKKAKQYCEKARVIAVEEEEMYHYGLATNTLGCIYNCLLYTSPSPRD